jgi:hypothetical protein
MHDGSRAHRRGRRGARGESLRVVAGEFIAAEARWERAEQAFARTVPTTPAGALLKLRAIEELLRAMPMADDSLEVLHVRALTTYLQRVCERS